VDSAFDFWEKLDDETYITLVKAQEEYASSSNPFENFEVLGRLLGISPRQVLAVYLLKHVVSLVKGVSLREALRGRVIDAIGYLKLLAYMDYLEQTDASENKLGEGMGN
jgi:hypothetical protein